MNHSPETRPSLLVRVRNTNDAASWHEFVRIYAPLIHAYGIRRGLQDADAADVAQQVMQSVSQALPEFQYDAAKGAFRGWLFTVTRNAVYKMLDRQRRLPTATGDTEFHHALAQQPSASDDDVWEQEYQRRLFRWAADRVRDEFRGRTWDAFWAVAIENKRSAEVAEQLGMSVGAVYVAKSRVINRIRQVIATVEDHE